jgi:ribonuclease P protein component
MARAQAEPPLRRPTPPIATLKHRSEFLRLRNGARAATASFVLEGKRRLEHNKDEAAITPRFGFTVSKKVGGAVERNRIKRRLRAAVREVAVEHAHTDFDYVLIARRPALDAGYGALVADLVRALGRVHAVPADRQRSERPNRVQRA